MRVLPSILSFYRKEFNKFNNIGTRMLAYFYHIAFRVLKILIWCENVNSLPSFMRHYNGRHSVALLNL